MEELYRNGAHPVNSQLYRHPSKVSTTSAGSSVSAHSETSSTDTHQSDGSRLSRQSSKIQTQEMGIQTTIGKSSNGIGPPLHQPENEKVKPKERKSSTKSKVKSLFKRKGSSETEIRIEDKPQLPALPQGFVVKYMGRRATKSMYGSKHTRAAVEEVIDSISHMPKNDDLPLVNLDVYYQGLAMRPHSKNTVKSYKAVQVPIQYISYGIQDTVYPRVFCFIMIEKMSAQEKSMECHVYACESGKSCKQLAACLASAFQAYNDQLKEGAIKFGVNVTMDPDGDKTSLEV